MARTEAAYRLTDDEWGTILKALRIALAVAELDAVKAQIRYDKDEMTYQSRLAYDLEEVLARIDR